MAASESKSPKRGSVGRHGDRETFSPGRTALLVIDPVNDFLSEGGAAWDLTKGTVLKNDVVPNLRRLVEGARAAGIPVLFGPMAYTEEDYADEQWQRRSGINRVMFERKMFLAGSWGADFHPDLQPLADEIVLQPHKGTDVFETDLPEHLERLGTTQLVIAGMTANLCCESTGRHATEHGYDVTFVWDAIGAESLPAYEASIRVNYPLIANAVMSVDEFVGAIDGSAGRPVAVRPGDKVRGSDHGEIGDVERVEFDGVTGGFMVVPRGMLFEKDTYIPLEAVVKRSGNTVFINVPKLVVGYMPWHEPPTAAAQQAKRGPRKDEVGQLYGSRSPSGAGG
jgi:ureidoacrylate peracid hydrolase